MANSSSIIRVSIIGDATQLTAALGQAQGKIVGIAKGIGAAFIGIQVFQEVLDQAGEALGEFDRLDDAITRLDNQLGGPLTDKLEATAGHFTDIGASKQDILELEANFADLGTTIGITDPMIASMGESVATTAFAFATLKELDPATVLKLMGEAADGSEKAAKQLGVTIEKGLSPTQQMNSILTQLAPALTTVAGATETLEGKQAKLHAQFETLQAKIGEALEGNLLLVFNWLEDMAEATGPAIAGWAMLWEEVLKAGDAFDPLLNALDKVWHGLLDIKAAIDQLPQLNPGGGLVSSGVLHEAQARRAQENWENRNQGRP